MKTRFLLLGLLGLLALSSCSTQKHQIKRQSAAEMDVYPVEGRHSWRWKRKVTAGEFTADRFKGGWVGSYEFPFFLNFRGSKEKFSFVQHDGQGNQAVVMAVDRFKTIEVPVVRNYFSIPIQYEQIFAGSVYLPARQQAYDFWLHFPDANTRITRTEGIIQLPKQKVEITGIQQLEGMSFKLPGNLGYNFLLDGEVVATVDAMDQGIIYLKKDLDSETRLVLVAVANGLMQRTK
jgi:hypothetical protein